MISFCDWVHWGIDLALALDLLLLDDGGVPIDSPVDDDAYGPGVFTSADAGLLG